RVFNAAWSQEVIRDNMDHILQGAAPNLVAYYRFDETGGITAHDRSGNGNDATYGPGTSAPVPTAGQPALTAANFGGRPWQSLGYYVATTGTLRVQLSDAADGVVAADSVRLVPAAPALTTLKSLDLRNNPLDNRAYDTFMPQLQAAGINVLTTPDTLDSVAIQ